MQRLTTHQDCRPRDGCASAASELLRCAGVASNLCALPARPADPRAELATWALTTFRELFARRSLIRTAMGELEERPDGFILRARHIDRSRLAPLRGKLRRGKGTFDLEAFRNTPHERTLRD